MKDEKEKKGSGKHFLQNIFPGSRYLPVRSVCEGLEDFSADTFDPQKSPRGGSWHQNGLLVSVLLSC